MKLFRIHFFVLVTLCRFGSIYGQGFVNLNFENATITRLPGFSYYLLESDAIPGWTGGPVLSDNGGLYIGYDTVSLGGPGLFLEDMTNGFGGLAPLQGRYSVLLEGATFGLGDAAIWQTGQIPSNARALTFSLSLNSSLQVTFNGQFIPLVQIRSFSNQDILGGDVSSFAGQTGVLAFTAVPNGGYGLLDNIQFSSSPVPEPSVLALLALGSLILGLRHSQ